MYRILNDSHKSKRRWKLARGRLGKKTCTSYAKFDTLFTCKVAKSA